MGGEGGRARTGLDFPVNCSLQSGCKVHFESTGIFDYFGIHWKKLATCAVH